MRGFHQTSAQPRVAELLTDRITRRLGSDSATSVTCIERIAWQHPKRNDVTAMLPSPGAALRDSKHPAVHLAFGAAEWDAFLRAVTQRAL